MPAKQASKVGSESKLRVPHPAGKSKERTIAEIALNPVMGAACNVLMFARGTVGPVDVTELAGVLSDDVKRVRKGDMAGPEAILVSQAQTLDAIFTEMARRSALNMGEYLEASEKYMRLALKAQAQCRATIETLATIKNPPLVIAKQANISAGPQQVNNGAAPPHAEVSNNQPNELLEHSHEPRLDPGATAEAGRGDPALVALETGNRT
jgi:hypothetical protein